MRISIHAGERFLQRVMKKKTYTSVDIDRAMKFLHKALKDVVPNSVNKHFVIPGLEDYKAVYCQNTIVTIIPKGERRC